MTYVLSDIHGNLRRFESIMAQINLQPDDTLYVLGDVIDRYPDGIKILRRIMQMPNAKMLIGNHEYMMLKAIGHCKDVAEEKENTNWRQRKIWYRNGGMVTHEQLKHYRKDTRSKSSTSFGSCRLISRLRSTASNISSSMPLPRKTIWQTIGTARTIKTVVNLPYGRDGTKPVLFPGDMC